MLGACNVITSLQQSLPAGGACFRLRTLGMTCTWTGVSSAKPFLPSARSSRGSRPRSLADSAMPLELATRSQGRSPAMQECYGLYSKIRCTLRWELSDGLTMPILSDATSQASR